MQIDLPSFLHSIAFAIQAKALLATPPVVISYLPTDTPQRNLWRNKAIEDDKNAAVKKCGDPYTTLRAYPCTKTDPANVKAFISIQMKTTGSSDDAAFCLATSVYECLALQQGNGLSNRMWLINGFDAVTGAAAGQWMIVNVDTIQRPGQIGRNSENNRIEIVSNVDVGFYKVS